MPSLADTMLASGFDSSMLPVHGEQIQVLTGADSGKTFSAVIEAKPNLMLEGVVIEDNREKIIAHFSNNNYPNVSPEDKMLDGNGVAWLFVERVINDHDNTTDFEFRKWVDNVDS